MLVLHVQYSTKHSLSQVSYVFCIDANMLSFLPNLIYYYGLNPDKAFEDEMEKILEMKTGIKQITFRQVIT